MLSSLALTYHVYKDISILLCLCKMFKLYGVHTCVVSIYISICEYKLFTHLIVLIVYDMFDMHAYLICYAHDRISFTLMYLYVYVCICV